MPLKTVFETRNYADKAQMNADGQNWLTVSVHQRLKSLKPMKLLGSICSQAVGFAGDCWHFAGQLNGVHHEYGKIQVNNVFVSIRFPVFPCLGISGRAKQRSSAIPQGCFYPGNQNGADLCGRNESHVPLL